MIIASEGGHAEIVKLLLEQDGIYINAKNIYLFSSVLLLIIQYFKIIIKILRNYYTQKSSSYFLNKMEFISMLRILTFS